MANNDREICMKFRSMIVQMVEINKMQSSRLYIGILCLRGLLRIICFFFLEVKEVSPISLFGSLNNRFMTFIDSLGCCLYEWIVMVGVALGIRVCGEEMHGGMEGDGV